MAAMATASFPLTNNLFVKAPSICYASLHFYCGKHNKCFKKLQHISRTLPENGNGNIRTHFGTQGTTCTFLFIGKLCRRISLIVDPLTEYDKISGTGDRTKSAPLATRLFNQYPRHLQSLYSKLMTGICTHAGNTTKNPITESNRFSF